MGITKETVDRISALSRLRLSEQEALQLTDELETIVTYMDILAQLPSGEDPSANQTPALCNVLRKDAAAPSGNRGELLSNAPSSDGETVLVPRTVDAGGTT